MRTCKIDFVKIYNILDYFAKIYNILDLNLAHVTCSLKIKTHLAEEDKCMYAHFEMLLCNESLEAEVRAQSSPQGLLLWQMAEGHPVICPQVCEGG